VRTGELVRTRLVRTGELVRAGELVRTGLVWTVGLARTGAREDWD
jgi:hypothetical protein